MTITLNVKPKVEAEASQNTAAEGAALQDHIDKIIVEAVKRQPPPLSHEEQR